eukprot:TRINITY_DN25384_c0_g1_i1.p1 TRINITY_DN25384_c0_g1~~TRINITY_DN25384_c0_g1_i1.p1  ORF type:complete len:1121 (+),score=287.70 TRINITY_DN25384_c0_g1_i1:173-3364(+)
MHIAARMNVEEILQNNSPLGEVWDSPLRSAKRKGAQLAPLKGQRERRSLRLGTSPLRTPLSNEAVSISVSPSPLPSPSPSPSPSPNSITESAVLRKEDITVQVPPSPTPTPQTSLPPTQAALLSHTRIEDLQYIKQLTMQSQLFLEDIERQKHTIENLEKENELFSEYKTERSELLANIKSLEKSLSERDDKISSLTRQLRMSKDELMRCNDELEELRDTVEAYKVKEKEAERRARDDDSKSTLSMDPMMCLSLDDDDEGSQLSANAPTGAVSLVFTDIQGSTRIWERAPQAMCMALTMHNNLVRSTIKQFNGYEVKTLGDAFMIAFTNSVDAVAFALTLQLQLLTLEWPVELEELADCPTSHFSSNTAPCGGTHVEAVDPMFLWRGLKVRIGVNTGEPLCNVDPCTARMDYLGPVVNKTARVENQAPGGLIAITKEVLDEITPVMSDLGMPSISLGRIVELKGIAEEVEIFSVAPKVLGERLTQSAPMYSGGQPECHAEGIDVVSSDEEDEVLCGVPSGSIYVCVLRLPKAGDLKAKLSESEWDELYGVWTEVLRQVSCQCNVPYEWWGDKKRDNDCDLGVVVFDKADRAVEWALKTQEKMQQAPWPEFYKRVECLKSKFWAGKSVQRGLCPRIAIHKQVGVLPTYCPFRKMAVYHPDTTLTPSVLSSASRPGQTLITSEVQQDLCSSGAPGSTSQRVASYMGLFTSAKLKEGSVVVYQVYPEAIFERMYLIMGFRDHPRTRRSEKFMQFERSVKDNRGGVDLVVERRVLDFVAQGLGGKSSGKFMEGVEKMRMCLEDGKDVSQVVDLHAQQALRCSFTDLKTVVLSLLQRAEREKEELMSRPHPEAVAVTKLLMSSHALVREFSALQQSMFDDTFTKEDEKALQWLKPKPGVYQTLQTEMDREPREVFESILGYLRILVGQTKQWKRFKKGTMSPPRRGSGYEPQSSPRRYSATSQLKGVFQRLNEDVERRQISHSPEKTRERKPSVANSARSVSPPKAQPKRWGLAPQAAARIRGRASSRPPLQASEPIGTLEGNSSPLHKPSRAPSIMRTPVGFNLAKD